MKILITHLMTSNVMVRTLKLSGSFFIFSLSVMQIRMTKMTRYDNGESISHPTKVVFFFSSPFSVNFKLLKCLLSSLVGTNEVYDGKYLYKYIHTIYQ